jgi:hypothetical protein
MTHPSDIAGLSERLRFDAARCELHYSKGIATNIEEAVTALDSLSARVKELEAFTKELSDALLSLRPLGGSECFVKRCGTYYADPTYFKGFIQCESDNRHEAMKDLARARKRATRAEQQRDEASRTLWFILNANGGFTLERDDLEDYPGADRAEIVSTKNDADGSVSLSAETRAIRREGEK